MLVFGTEVVEDSRPDCADEMVIMDDGSETCLRVTCWPVEILVTCEMVEMGVEVVFVEGMRADSSLPGTDMMSNRV